MEYSLRGAEVYVGSLNFELLLPIPGGTSLFHDYLAEHGEGICSIASMFHDREHGDLVKKCFHDRFGLEVFNKADMGNHIEYFYVDTQADFGCPIESGSGHAIDFEGPDHDLPDPEATFGPSPDSGIASPRSRSSSTTSTPRSPTTRPHSAGVLGGCSTPTNRACSTTRATEASRRALTPGFQAMVGDINFREIIKTSGGDSPWQAFRERHGEGLMGIAVAPESPATSADVIAQFNRAGIVELASGDVGDVRCGPP